MTTATITSVSDPVWASELNDSINCNITTTQFGDEVLPYTATSYDPDPNGRQFFYDLVDGKYGPIGPYVPPPEPTPEPDQPNVSGAQTL